MVRRWLLSSLYYLYYICGGVHTASDHPACFYSNKDCHRASNSLDLPHTHILRSNSFICIPSWRGKNGRVSVVPCLGTFFMQSCLFASCHALCSASSSRIQVSSLFFNTQDELGLNRELMFKLPLEKRWELYLSKQKVYILYYILSLLSRIL